MRKAIVFIHPYCGWNRSIFPRCALHGICHRGCLPHRLQVTVRPETARPLSIVLQPRPALGKARRLVCLYGGNPLCATPRCSARAACSATSTETTRGVQACLRPCSFTVTSMSHADADRTLCPWPSGRGRSTPPGGGADRHERPRRAVGVCQVSRRRVAVPSPMCHDPLCFCVGVNVRFSLGLHPLRLALMTGCNSGFVALYRIGQGHWCFFKIPSRSRGVICCTSLPCSANAWAMCSVVSTNPQPFTTE